LRRARNRASLRSVSPLLDWENIVLAAHFVLPILLGLPAVIYIYRFDDKKTPGAETSAAAGETKGKALAPLHCPACGGPVPLESDSFPCVHCGATVRPPDDYVTMLALRQSAVDELRRAERRWRWSRWSSSRPFTIALRVSFLAWFVLICFVEMVVDYPRPVLFLGLIVALLESVLGWATASVYADEGATLPPLPDRHFLDVPAEVSTCAGCGGPIRFREGALAAICPYCGADDYREHLASAARADASGKEAAAQKSLLAAVRQLDSRRKDIVGYFAFIGFAEVFYAVVFGLAAVGDWMGC